MKKAAELAKLKEYHANSYPAEASWIDQLLDKVSKNNSYLDAELHEALGEYYEPLRFVKTINQRSAIQARIPYYINIQ